MKQIVAIKGTKSGIILVLDQKTPFDELKVEIRNKFTEAAGFLGKNNMGLIIRGRTLDEVQQNEVLNIISETTKLTITCIIDEESAAEKLFVNAAKAKKAPKETTDKEVKQEKEIRTDIINPVYNNNAQIYVGNLRSGQDVSCEQNVVILGDVKPGANVTSYGSIFILGELRGNAFAGASGDKNAIVMALNLNPLQVRIADAIAISPDAEKGPKLRFRRKKVTDSENEPEVAYIENGHIVKSLYGPSFLRQYLK